MQTDQATHEAGQYDGLIAALNDTKASLGSILKAAPGINTIHTTLAVILILTECQSTIMMTTNCCQQSVTSVNGPYPPAIQECALSLMSSWPSTSCAQYVLARATTPSTR